MRRKKKATLRDVAARAGVSTTTVSLFLHGRTEVCSAQTAERIRAALQELHYVPIGRPAPPDEPQAARMVPTRTIGVCMAVPFATLRDPSARNDYVERIWRGIGRAADVEDYGLLHYARNIRDIADPAPFLDGRIDGLILVAGHQDPRPARLAGAGLPVVLLTPFLEIPDGCGAVYPLEGDTVELAITHLWDLGHRRIAHVAGPTTPPAPGEPDEPAPPTDVVRYEPNDNALRRLDRYEAAMKVREVYDPALVFPANSWRAQRGAEALAALCRLPDPPTAVFCANDSLALGVLAAARQTGVRIPEELSVVGVDNSVMGAGADPPLTSVELPGEEVGVEAMRQLLRLLEGAPAESCRAGVPVTNLVARATTAAPRPKRK